MAAGFLVNSFAATQDVAVDGMAIDVLPPAERGRANAFMAFGQVIGVAGTGAVAGMLLATYGLFLTGIIAGLVVASILCVVIAFRERQGERLLPWTEGAEHPDAAGLSSSLFGLFGDLRRALLLPMSLVLSASVFSVRIAGGVLVACLPVFAVQELGYASADYSQLIGTLIGIAAFAGLAIGPLVDRFGPRRFMIGALAAGALMQVTFVLLQGYWSVQMLVVSLLATYLLVEQTLFISLIAQYMNVTWQKVAATQFAVYMALANLGRSTGAGLFASIAGRVDYATIFLIVAGLFVLALLLMLVFSERRLVADVERLSRQDARPDVS